MTALSPLECQELLLDVLEDETRVPRVTGTVTSDTFELHRTPAVRAGAYPVIRGTFSPQGTWTRVEYRAGRSRKGQPIYRIAAVIWALMALSWVVFFLYWLVDRDGIEIGLSRLILLLGIIVLMGATIAAGRRSDEEGTRELVDMLYDTLPPVERTAAEDEAEARA